MRSPTTPILDTLSKRTYLDSNCFYFNLHTSQCGGSLWDRSDRYAMHPYLMSCIDADTGIKIDADFECGSGGAIRKIGPSVYAVDPKPENLKWFAFTRFSAHAACAR